MVSRNFLNALFLLAIVFAFGCSPKSSLEEDTREVQATLQQFYAGHIPDDPYTPQGNVKWQESGLVSQEFTSILNEWNYNSEIFNAEPFLCAQANPPKWKIGPVTVTATTAEGTVEMMYGQTLHAIKVYLVKENGVWKINATECFPTK